MKWRLLFAALLASHAALASLQDQIDAAAPGAILTVGPGVYPGSIVISRPLTLIGRDFPVLDGNGEGRVIQIRAGNVTVRGFRITGSGINLSEDDAAVYVAADNATVEGNRIDDSLHGVYMKKVRGTRVLRNVITGKSTLDAPTQPAGETIVADSAENCSTTLNINERGNGIHLWNSGENIIDGNEINETRDGMYFSFTHNTIVRDNTIRRVRYGLHYMYSDNNTFENNVFTDNAAGSAIMFSKSLLVRGNRFLANHGFRAYGMLLSWVDTSRFERNEIRGNTVGIYLENSNGNALIGNEIARNYIGVRLTASSDSNHFSRNTFAGNMHPAELAGESETNRWTVGGVGNRWLRSETMDFNGDGIGDFPHREADLLGKLRRPFPLVGLLSGSPGLELLRFAHRRVALRDIQAITDPAPLTPAFRSVTTP